MNRSPELVSEEIDPEQREKRYVEIAEHARSSGEALRMLRELQELTQEEVAHVAGISKSEVSRIETGKRHPSIFTLIVLLVGSFSLRAAIADHFLVLAGYARLQDLRSKDIITQNGRQSGTCLLH